MRAIGSEVPELTAVEALPTIGTTSEGSTATAATKETSATIATLNTEGGARILRMRIRNLGGSRSEPQTVLEDSLYTNACSERFFVQIRLLWRGVLLLPTT